MSLVLSLFPGLGLLDMGFEAEGFCVVRGPDVLWGGDVRTFHVPEGKFSGVIGGPPCQAFSQLSHMVRHRGYEPKFGNLIPEFERVVAEAQPEWFLMENVSGAPVPSVPGYTTRSLMVNNRWFAEGDSDAGAEQHRQRRISFGTKDGRALVFDVALFEKPAEALAGRPGRGRTGAHAVVGVNSPVPIKLNRDGSVKSTWGQDERPARDVADVCELQGLPRDFAEHLPFRKEDKWRAIANGVPLPTGRALARAVKRAIDAPAGSDESR